MNPLLLALMGNPAGGLSVGQSPQQAPQQAPQQMPQQGMGGIEALMGNPAFGAGLGLLGAASGGGNPYQAALTGMLGTSVFKRQQQEYALKSQEQKLQQQQIEAQQKLMEANRREATKLYQTFSAKAQEGGIDPWEQATLSQLQIAIETGSNFTDVASQMKQPEQKGPLSTVGKLAQDLASGAITQDQFNAAYTKATTPTPLVQFGQEPIGTDAPKWRNASGEQPSPLMTPSDAVAQGFNPVTTGQSDAINQAGMSAPALGAMMGFGGIGTDRSLFSPDGSNIGDRAIAAASARIKAATSDPNSPELLSYTTFKDATLSGLARLVGQVGALTERDVQSVAGLWPVPGLDTEGVAANKFRNIVTLLKSKGVGESYLNALGVPSQFLGEQSDAYESEGPP